MAVAKGLVLAAIEKAFKGKSLSKTFKENLSVKWADKIDTEDDIDDFVSERTDEILEASAEADRRANSARIKALEEAREDKGGKGNKSDTGNDDDDEELPADTPEWAKQVLKQNAELKRKVESFEQSQSLKGIEERFKNDPLLKGLPKAMFKGRIPQKEEDYESYRDELIEDYKGMMEANPSLPALGQDAPPRSSNQQKQQKNDAKVSPEIEAFVKKNNPEKK